LIVSEQGRNIDALEQSILVMVRIVSYSPDNGSFMIKSKAIILNRCAFSAGEMGKSGGWAGFWLVLDI
jgi:hypothetical protein